MKLVIALALVLLSSPALAQQQQLSPAEGALQINSIAVAMAQAMIQQGHTIEELQKQIVTKDAKIKELEEKVKQ